MKQFIRTTTTITWADTINNDANWTAAWTISEYAKISVSDLNLAYSNGQFKLEEIQFVGTGTAPSAANKQQVEILIAGDAGFTNILSHDLGIMSDAKYDTTKCIASFHPQHYIEVGDATDLYITVKCATSAALLASSGRITISQQ